MTETAADKSLRLLTEGRLMVTRVDPESKLVVARCRGDSGQVYYLDAATIDRVIGLMGVPESGECWPWMGYVGTKGYGQVRIGGRGGPLLPAHRVIYEIFIAPARPGFVVDHLCHNGSGCPGGSCKHRSCVNPYHLEEITNAENIRRGEAPAGRHARAEACTHGHPFDVENTHILKNGARYCRACGRDRANARYRSNRGHG